LVPGHGQPGVLEQTVDVQRHARAADHSLEIGGTHEVLGKKVCALCIKCSGDDDDDADDDVDNDDDDDDADDDEEEDEEKGHQFTLVLRSPFLSPKNAHSSRSTLVPSSTSRTSGVSNTGCARPLRKARRDQTQEDQRPTGNKARKK
jgi:hypothetical protein